METVLPNKTRLLHVCSEPFKIFTSDTLHRYAPLNRFIALFEGIFFGLWFSPRGWFVCWTFGFFQCLFSERVFHRMGVIMGCGYNNGQNQLSNSCPSLIRKNVFCFLYPSRVSKRHIQ